MSQRTLGDAKAQERIDEVENHSLLWVTKERDNFFKFYTDSEKELSKAKLALQGLAEALQLFQDRMNSYGEWDDGCFYYNGKSATELQQAIDKARAALDAAKPFLKGATDGNQ